MKLNPRHTGTVRQGKFIPDNPDFFKFDVEGYEGKIIEVEIHGRKETRSLKMNRFYWSIVIKTARQEFNNQQCFGHDVTDEWVHEFFKAKFLGLEKVMSLDKTIVEMPRHSKELDNGEFIRYFEQIIAFAAEFLGCEIPLPNEELIET